MRLANVVGWTLLLAVIAFWPLSWLGFFLPKIIVICVGLALCAVSILLQKSDGKGGLLYLSKPLYGVLAYFAATVIFIIFSIAPWASFLGVSASMQGLMVNVVYAMLFFIALMLQKNEWPKVWNILVWANCLVVFYGLLQLLHLDLWARYWDLDYMLGRPFSTLGNPNWLASFLLLTLPIVYESRVRNSVKNYFGILLIGANVLLIFMTASKAGILALLLLLAGFLWMKGKRKTVLLMLMSALVLGTFVLSYFYTDSFALLRSASGRMIIWTQTYKLLASWPWGHGLDMFRYVFPQWNVASIWQYEDLANTIDNPHSQFLNLLVQGGPVFAVLFYGMVAKVVWPKLKKNNFLAWGLVAYLFSNLFGFEVLPNGLLFWLIMAHLVSLNVEKKGVLKIPAKPLLIAIFTISVFFTWFNWLHLRGDFLYERSLQNLAKGAYAEAVNDSYAATVIFPYDRVMLLHAAETVLVLEQPDDSLLKQVEVYLNRLDFLSNKKDPDVPVLRAWLAAKTGNLQLCEQQLSEAKKVNPVAVSTYKIAVQIYHELGDAQGEKRELDNLKKLLPAYWDQPQTEQGRIFQKNYPWLIKLFPGK